MGANTSKPDTLPPVPEPTPSVPEVLPTLEKLNSEYTGSYETINQIPIEFIKDWLLTLKELPNVSELSIKKFIQNFNRHYHLKENGVDKNLKIDDIAEYIMNINNNPKYTDVPKPLKIVYEKDFLCQHVRKWVDTLPDKQRITDSELNTFLKKFDNEINKDRIYYSEKLLHNFYSQKIVQECFDKMNEAASADMEEIGFNKYDRPKLTSQNDQNKYMPKPTYSTPTLVGSEEQIPELKSKIEEFKKSNQFKFSGPLTLNYNPAKLIELFNELEPVQTSNGVVNILPYITNRSVLDFINTYPEGYMANQLRMNLSPFYAKILVLFLKVFKKNLRVDLSTLCSEQLMILEDIYLTTGEQPYKYVLANASYDDNSSLYNTKRFFEVFINDESLDTFLSQFPDITEENKEYFRKRISPYISRTQNQFKTIKEEFAKCTNQYYMIPFVTDRLGIDSAHQNLIILDKLNEHVIYIEPQYYGRAEQFGKKTTSRQNTRLNTILKELGIPEYQKILPITEYPQSIAEDKNCMFWTFLITVTFLLNPEINDPDIIANAIIQKYPDKNKLVNYITSFRSILAKFFYELEKDIKGGKKRRRTYRKKSISQKQIVSKSSRNLRIGTSKSNTYR